MYVNLNHLQLQFIRRNRILFMGYCMYILHLAVFLVAKFLEHPKLLGHCALAHSVGVRICIHTLLLHVHVHVHVHLTMYVHASSVPARTCTCPRS